MLRRLPIGIQSFEKLRTRGFVYVDKTEYVYRLVHSETPYFLSRPRRFGKSLLLSTLKAYYEGKKDLFKGLAIEKLEKENAEAWRPAPIFYFDFNGEDYTKTDIETVLDQFLTEWEDAYRISGRNGTLGFRFRKLLETAYLKTGRRCVVLVDEYDKPLLDEIENESEKERTKNVFKGFFSVLKKADDCIQFIFITGVSKFHKVSIFSDLNQLRDISLTKDYAALCGITESELEQYFEREITEFSEELNVENRKCLDKLRETYDGYRFHPDGDYVYNPYSLLNALSDRDFGSYWFETGTPAFLVKKLRKMEFDVWRFSERTIYATERTLKDYTGDTDDPIPLLYQTGYLTIADFDREIREYTLDFPNAEVKYGFVESLIPEYVGDYGSGAGNDVLTLRRYAETGDLDGMRRVLTSLFANITYTVSTDPFEHYFQTVIWLTFTLLGKYALCEMHTCSGRIDCKVETKSFIYLFEFKRDDPAEAALAQINSRDYGCAFVADSRRLYKIGVSFDSAKRRLAGWEVESAEGNRSDSQLTV